MIDIVTEEVLIFFNFLFYRRMIVFSVLLYLLFLCVPKKIMTKKYTGGGLVHIYHRYQSLIIITH